MIPLIPTHVLYDWDNTLVDAWSGITIAMNAALTGFGLAPWTEADTRARARLPLGQAFPPMFGPDWPRARDLFYAALEGGHLAALRVLPGRQALIAALPAGRQAVVSNKSGPFLRAEIGHLGWERRFAATIGAGDAPADKPHPDPIWLALQRLGAEPGPAIWYVGDTALDMQAARAAGVTAVLLGDAAHDGGIDRAAPDLHFFSAEALMGAFSSTGSCACPPAPG
ncbi:MAG: HAD family hydrolase [Rhodospirillales bacterium]|nr:HAD family hydrolase [Rhodospirillales bacterium]